MKEFYSKLGKDKIKINWNKNPIKMNLFLSFLTEPTEKQTKFLGCLTDWTQYTGENNLEIMGGVVGGVEYLDHLQYGKNLDNPYNSYVNPFYLFDIFTEAGKAFFREYYANEINEIIESVNSKALLANVNKEKVSEFWARHGFGKDLPV